MNKIPEEKISFKDLVVGDKFIYNKTYVMEKTSSDSLAKYNSKYCTTSKKHRMDSETKVVLLEKK